MDLTPAQRQLRDGFFNALLETTLRLKEGPDRELIQELLLQAAEMLRDHLEQELAEIRLEQVE
jgi:hypothetical protein